MEPERLRCYGTKDKKWFYSGQVAYSFNKREYVLWEFPKHYIAFKYTYDVMSPMDKYLATDKDNLFVGWKWTTVDQMSYMRDATLTYELETNTGFSVQAMARHRTTSLRATAILEEQRRDTRDNGTKKKYVGARHHHHRAGCDFALRSR